MHDTRTSTTRLRLRLLLLLALTFLIASIAPSAWAAPLASFKACSASLTSPPTSPTAKTSLPRPRAGRRPSTDLGEAPGTAGRVGAPYDSAGRLYSVFIDGAGTPSFEYSYTANGSRTGATVDAQDRTTAYSGASYTYGPNGDRATKTVAGATTSYVYDARGNLRSVTTFSQ